MKKAMGPWNEMFLKLVGDLALFIYHLQSRFPAIRLVPEEYPNDLNQNLPSNSARLLVVTEYETVADPKKIRNRPHVLYNLIVAGVLPLHNDIDQLRQWSNQKKYEEAEKKIRKAVNDAINGREFFLKFSRRRLKEMREDIFKHGLGLFFRNDPLDIGLEVQVRGTPIKGIQSLGYCNIRLPWTELFPKETPERKYFDKIAFWNRFWNQELPWMIEEGVVVDPQATWRSCQKQIYNCRRVIEDTLKLSKETIIE